MHTYAHKHMRTHRHNTCVRLLNLGENISRILPDWNQVHVSNAKQSFQHVAQAFFIVRWGELLLLLSVNTLNPPNPPVSLIVFYAAGIACVGKNIETSHLSFWSRQKTLSSSIPHVSLETVFEYSVAIVWNTPARYSYAVRYLLQKHREHRVKRLK